MKWLLVFCLAGCALSGRTVARHTPPPPYALDAISFDSTRAGQLSASRMWERNPSNRAVHATDDDVLMENFAGELSRVIPLDPNAPRHLRATLTLQDTGYFEGLATETSDVTLWVEVRDGDGNVVKTITMREPASAPLQRSASRRARLQVAFDRLAERLAAQL